MKPSHIRNSSDQTFSSPHTIFTEAPRYNDTLTGYKSYDIINRDDYSSLSHITNEVDCTGVLLTVQTDKAARSKVTCQLKCTRDDSCLCYTHGEKTSLKKPVNYMDLLFHEEP